MANKLRGAGYTNEAEQMEAFLADRTEIVQRIIKHRNKRLAHNDATQLLNGESSKGVSITKGEFDDLIREIGSVFNRCTEAIFGYTTAFEYSTLPDGGADRLHRGLQRVTEYESIRKSIPMGRTLKIARNLGTGRIEIVDEN